jgi:hypothetical protein
MARDQPRGSGQRAGRHNRADAGRAVRGAGSGIGRGNGGRTIPPQQQAPAPPQQPAYVTEQHVMAKGFRFGGFPGERQNVRLELNRERFRALYGVSPKAVQVCTNDLSSKGFDLNLEDVLMAMNWLRLYDTEHVLAARWGLSEESIRNCVKKCCKAIQSLKDDKSVWIDQPNVTFMIVSVDGTHCRIFEPRTDPGSKSYSHKFNGPGVSSRHDQSQHCQGPSLPIGRCPNSHRPHFAQVSVPS